MKYNFLQDNWWRPYFDTNTRYSMLWEISWIETNYIKKIVQELEEVKSWERERMTFWAGNGMTTVFCTSDNNNAIIFYGDDELLEVPFEEIYNLMKDWLKYIEEWEKETGEIYPR